MNQLTLTAKEFTVSEGIVRWHWRLFRPGGNPVGDSPGRLPLRSAEYEQISDLYGWLERHPAEAADAEQVLGRLGAWLSATVLGSIAPLLEHEAPCAVRLWQDSAAPLDVISLPLELALVNGRPLARQQVSFVITPGGADPHLSDPGPLPPPAPGQPDGPLRVLGLFSLPDGEQSLNLRKERHELEQLARQLTGSGRTVSLARLQYGTTREALREQLDAGGGWDIVHLSGHGRAGVFVLEGADGRADRVSGDALVDLLSPLRNRVRLVTVSACESAEYAGRRQLALLPGGGVASGGGDGGSAAGGSASGASVGGSVGGSADAGTALALQLAQRLNCAVLGLRYPVAEPFAAAFTEKLYDLLLDKGQALARARAGAAAQAATSPATAERPALSLIAPVLYGASALTLTVRVARSGPPVFGFQSTKLAGVPAEPDRFVGRSGPMTRVAAALAPASGHTMTVIEGMAEIGKTALAREAARGHADKFVAITWHAFTPDEAGGGEAGGGRGSGLAGLARALSAKIPGLDLSPLSGGEEEARAFAAQVSAYFADLSALVVLDNADVELTETGRWRDERLALLVGALSGHGGLGRLMVTTRRPVAGADHAVRLGPLPEAEAALLASELPGLKGLLDGSAPQLNAAAARGLARDVLGVTRGHPGLLALAAAQAGQPLRLIEMLAAAQRIWESQGADADAEAAYQAILSAWRTA